MCIFESAFAFTDRLQFLAMVFGIHLVAEAIAFLASTVVYLRREETIWLKWFPPFLFITLVVEVAGYETSIRNIHNVLLYNPYQVLMVMFYLFVLHHVVSSVLVKKIILFFLRAFPLLACALLLIEGPNVYNSTTIMIGALIVVAFCFYYFYEILVKVKVLNMQIEPQFWIIMAALFFFSVTIPMLGSRHPYFDFSVSFLIKKERFFEICIAIFYILLSIGFLCKPAKIVQVDLIYPSAADKLSA